MRLSDLQKYILLAVYESGNKRIGRGRFARFYATQKKKPKERAQVKIITQSLERLIDRELMIGYGVRTPHKWFINEVKLTPKGRQQARKVLEKKQQRLPLKKSK